MLPPARLEFEMLLPSLSAPSHYYSTKEGPAEGQTESSNKRVTNLAGCSGPGDLSGVPCRVWGPPRAAEPQLAHRCRLTSVLRPRGQQE